MLIWLHRSLEKSQRLAKAGKLSKQLKGKLGNLPGPEFDTKTEKCRSSASNPHFQSKKSNALYQLYTCLNHTDCAKKNLKKLTQQLLICTF